MPNVDSLTKLREAIADADRAIESHCAAYECGDAGLESAQRERAVRDRSTALAAVEQEMAKLARSEAYLAERVEALEAQQALRAQEMAELRKDHDHRHRLYIEACESGSGHARIAELEAVVGKQDALIRDLESDNARMLQELTHFNPELR